MKPDCDISEFDEKDVRVTTVDGEAFDGVCVWNSAEYGMAELGREEEALEIDHWLFYRDEILAVRLRMPGEPPLWMGRPLHRMRLQPEPYRLIEAGTKTYELRLYDEKRQKIGLGDVIRFENTTDNDEVLFAKVEELRVFSSFEELYRTLPLRECGYTPETEAAASPKDMERYYPPEEQRRYGVVGIRISLL